MSLTKEAIIEIQTSAKFNYFKQVRMQEEAAKQKQAIEEALEASRKPKAEVKEEVAPKKGK